MTENLKKEYSYHELSPKTPDARFARYVELCRRCGADELVAPNTTTKLYLPTEFSSQEKIRCYESELDWVNPHNTFQHEWCKPKVVKWHETDLSDAIDEDLPYYIHCEVWRKGSGFGYRQEAGLKSIEATWPLKRICGPGNIQIDQNRKVHSVLYRSKTSSKVDPYSYTREYEITHLKPYKHHKAVKADRDFLLAWYRYFVEPSLEG